MLRLQHARYEPREELGRGAQGVVVRVVDREAPARALVAKIWNGGALSPELLRGEFALLSRLQIAGLVRAHDLGRDERSGAPFLVEEWVDGPDALEWLARAGDVREKRARLLRLLADVAATLAELHDAGFLHGDLKPAHVRLSPSGRAMLLDLGAAVARARPGRAAEPVVAVSAGFAAPELLAGAPASPASDAYAFGALGWTLATGRPPGASRARLREQAPWMIPSLAELIERLLSAHPQDRRGDMRQIIGELGALMRDAGIAARAGAAVESVSSGVRERELATLERQNEGVRYLEGSAGMGKSVLLRELVTRARLKGRSARLVRFPCDEPALVTRLIGFFRGVDELGPFAATGLLALDDLQSAPSELVAAVDALRCRPGAARGLDVVAAVRTAPEGSEVVRLGALGASALGGLARELGANEAELGELLQAARGNPGWIAAALGRVPLTRQAVLDRAEPLSSAARELLALCAVLGGETPEASCEKLVGPAAPLALSELLAAGLVTRRSERRAEPADGTTSSVVYGLGQPALAGELAEALADFELVDRVADLLLESGPAHAATLLALSSAPNPPSRRADLLRKAAELARSEGLRSEETDALLALAADPRERTRDVLLALDRVTRGGGSVGLHPEVVGWLEEAAERDPTLGVLALRRRAEQRARSGELEEAAGIAARALEMAEREGDSTALSLALSTVGSVALHRADWTAAESAIERAHTRFASGAVEDAEEVARLYHNRGVISLYRHRLDEAREAFERSLHKKRALGDRGGVWACLLNLGITLAQSSRFEDSERALGEALALTRALGQRAGTGWCLAALADLCVRRGDARSAERWVAEAEHLFDVLPAAVHADVCILRAEIALLEGDGASCLTALRALPSELRARDALVDARALAAEARGTLIKLPSDRRAAARGALKAVRRAREAGLPELEQRGLEVLRIARRSTSEPEPLKERYHPLVAAEPDPLWSTVEALARGASREQAALELATRVLEQSGAERVFVALATENGELSLAWGVDLDKLPIAEASRRLPAELISGALRRSSPLYQPNVEGPAGRGSRLAIASAPGGTRGLVVAEHRFVSGRFDAVSEEQARRWATIAALLSRVEAPAQAPSGVAAHSAPPSVARSSEPTTALPLTARSRSFPALVGASSELERALLRLDAAIESDLPVLIAGETGVGKELFARALHEHGERSRAPFVAVSCGAIPDSLIEAELFGHARGSFTGADRARPGLLARAETGTLFLDEIGELPLARQATLLRAISTGSYRPVGSDDERPFDVRIVAATNRDLEQGVSDGSFRQDLYYRLNVLEIRVPALRERTGDIARLAHHFLEGAGSNAILSPLALEVLEAYTWPGNVRELEHQMQRLSALRLDRIEVIHLSREIREGARRVIRGVRALRPASVRPRAPRTVDDERDQVRVALERHRGNITHAARELGVTRQGLKKRMLRLGLREPQGERREHEDRAITRLRAPARRVKKEDG